MRLVVEASAETNHFRCIELWPKISCMTRHRRHLKIMSNRWSRWSTWLYRPNTRIQRLVVGPSRRSPHNFPTRTLSSPNKATTPVYSLKMRRLE